MATIYKAEDLRLGRKVAIKILSDKLAQDPEILSRFLREAQSAAKLIHPNIVNVYDIEEFNGIHYIVMELLEARNLKSIIVKHAPFETETALKLFRQMASAVKFAHENGIIHRDLKPQNVMVNSQGILKVTDFGIARAVTASSLTHTGSMMGSVQYFSPEQAQGKPVDRTADIYSLGIILYEMFTGKLPFDGDNLVAIALKQVQEDPPPPSSFNPEISREMERIILKALAKNPAERFQDMDEFIAAIEQAESPSAYYEEPLVKKASAVETTMVMGSGGRNIVQKVDSARNRDDEDDEDDEEEETETKKSPMPVYVLILLAFMFVITYSLYKRGDLSLMMTKDTVPDLVAISLEDARKKVDSMGWQIQIEEEVFNAKVPEGIIISQKPAMGEKLPRGGVIYVVISKGSTKAEVPDLTGLSVDEVKNILTAKKLGWIIKDSVYSDTVKKDCVVSQDPAPGEEVAPGKKIQIVISLGSKKVEVPDITGMTKDKAIAELRRRGLQLVVEGQKKDSNVPENQILSQKPAAGQQVDPGSKVSVIISSGSEIAIAPDLVGKTLGEAMQMLDTLKIRIDVTDGSSDQKAKVVGQDPPAGSQLDTKVVKVWCTEEIKVPGVVGKKLEDAQNSISAAGLRIKIDYVESPEAAGTVLSQEPGAGVSADKEAIIVITVAKKQTSAPVEPTPAETKPASTPQPAPEAPVPGGGSKKEDNGVKIIR